MKPQRVFSDMASVRSFKPFFRAACVEISQRHQVSRSRVAANVGVSDVTIKRFEEGITFPDENLDAYAAGYGKLDGVPPYAIFSRASARWEDLWKETIGSPERPAEDPNDDAEASPHGDFLSFESLLEHFRIAERAARRASDPATSSSEEPPNATRKSQAIG